jgi:hypothetical protein
MNKNEIQGKLIDCSAHKTYSIPVSKHNNKNNEHANSQRKRLENVYRRFGCNKRYKPISFHVTGIERSAEISIDMNSHIGRAGNGVNADKPRLLGSTMLFSN